MQVILTAIYLLVLSGFATLHLTSAFAAEFDKIDLPGDYPDFVTLKGEIKLGDSERFIEVIGDSSKVTVILESPGGIVKDALEIGAEIRLRNYATMVSADTGCYSACALIWVAGARRYMDPNSEIGFHAVYHEENGELRESGMGNAEVGAFLTHLGLRIEAIRYFTLAGPKDLLLLSPDKARSLGIDVFEQSGSDFITPQQAPTVDEYASRFSLYLILGQRCSRYFGTNLEFAKRHAIRAAETAAGMVSNESWIELWMREGEVNKRRLQEMGSLAFCLDLESRFRLAGLDTGIYGPSFDCRKAATQTEIAICRTPSLWAPDNANAAIYFWMMNNVDVATKKRIRGVQRDWLQYRNTCGGNDACLIEVYGTRLRELGEIELPG
ncbi:hypothetical protein [Labrenzia sp. VG12]|uniref:hypothetical protein n=1 Tax=Labrenzia sp. VG12 TaxID=2021862 RepID=UPI000B8C13DE|nr:hypothetical protein [Labrenzia sp. VG12]ASP35469.1 hypothetical protein CHH27_21315 [Labrenzia sp. VG12]